MKAPNPKASKGTKSTLEKKSVELIEIGDIHEFCLNWKTILKTMKNDKYYWICSEEGKRLLRCSIWSSENDEYLNPIVITKKEMDEEGEFFIQLLYLSFFNLRIVYNKNISLIVESRKYAVDYLAQKLRISSQELKKAILSGAIRWSVDQKIEEAGGKLQEKLEDLELEKNNNEKEMQLSIQQKQINLTKATDIAITEANIKKALELNLRESEAYISRLKDALLGAGIEVPLRRARI